MAQRKKLAPLPVHPAHSLHTDYLCMVLPLLAWAIFLYGLRPLVVWLIAVVTAKVCSRIISAMRSRRYDPTEDSSTVHASLLVMLLPATIPYYVVVITVAVGVFLAKEAFGGYGAYPFHPTAVSYTVAAVSWPEYVFAYSAPFQRNLALWGELGNVQYTENINSVMRAGGIPTINQIDLVLGNYATAIGTAPVLIILSCGLFLFIRKRINLWVPVAFLLGAAAVAWCCPRIGEVQGLIWQNTAQRFQSVKFELLSGAMLFSAVFLSCEPCTAPKNTLSKLVYGLFWGVLTMMYRYYGTYETGVCFALLIMNAGSGYIDRVTAKLIAKYKGGIGRVG